MNTIAAQTNRQFQVLQHRLGWLNDQIGKLAKRATKLGVVPPSVHVMGAPFTVRNGADVLVYVNVEIKGEAPVLPGWGLAAVINVIEGEGIIKSLPGVLLPDSFKHADAMQCDHCNTRRVRNDTFVLQADDGVTFKQVGRSCLKDFLPGGHTSPDALAWYANAIDVALSAAREAGVDDGMGGGKTYTDLVSFLGFVACSSREHGWVSRKEAYETDKTATADIAMSQLTTPSGSRFMFPTPEDMNLAAQAAEWAANLSDIRTESNEFLHNIRTLGRLGVIDHRTYRMAAATVTSFQREAGASAQQFLKPVAQRGFVGTIGKKEVFQATMVEFFAINGKFGPSNVGKFSVEGNLVTAFFNKPLPVKVGETTVLRGTVKAHDVYRPKVGEPTPQTTLSYATVG